MSEPLVTVIVPVYNVEDYIGLCVRSLMAQTYRNIEFIFVNDGTPDNSVKVIEDNIDSSRKIQIVNKENEGIPQARLTGIKCAHGYYVLYLDSDDWIEPDAVEKLVSKAEETGADLVYFDFWKEYNGHRKLDTEKFYTASTKERWMHRLYNDGAYGYIWAKFARRSLYDGIFFPRHNMHDDVVISTQVIWKCENPVHLKVPLVHYRRDNLSSATLVNKVKRRGQMARNYLDLYEFYKDSLSGSPAGVVLNDIMLRSAWVAYSMDRNLFEERPYLKEMAAHLPLMPGHRVLLFQQIILKLWLHFKR